MSDLISKSALIEEFEIQRLIKEDRLFTISQINALIKTVPPVEPVRGEWIPCSERPPKKAGKYLVTMIEGGAVHTSVRRFNPKPTHPKQNEPVFTKHLPYYSGWERATRGVIAWQPLPKPYNPGGKKVEE